MNNFLMMGLGGSGIGCGLMAGIYFAFSGFLMRSLEATDGPVGIAAMQSINRVILSSSFMPLFWVTTGLSAALAVVGVARWGTPGSMMLVAGGVVYVLGMFVCTAAFNVPLNDALDAVDPAELSAASVWGDYLRRWTAFNHVRCAASLTTCALFLAAAWGLR